MLEKNIDAFFEKYPRAAVTLWILLMAAGSIGAVLAM